MPSGGALATASALTFAKGGLDNSGKISATDGFVDIWLSGGAITNSGTISAGNGDVDIRTADTGAITNSGTVTATGGIDAIATDGDVRSLSMHR